MARILEDLYGELKNIRVYLIKIGQIRRQDTNVCKKKLGEANSIFQRYNCWLSDLNDSVKKGKISSDDFIVLDKGRKQFISLYNEVLNLCQCESSDALLIMDSFNLRTALNLIPAMTDEESNTKQVIDNIEYYDSVLKSKECKNNLIMFVLKSRLSQAAKLKLNSNYESIHDLIVDMRKELLPRKSASAIQSRLQIIRQNEMTISEYGRLITELFVDLTITQADGNAKNYDVLKPVNENFAIKKFADGLRNRRLSTIIAARNFSSLKDAIQAAQDEEMASASTPAGEILGMHSNTNSDLIYYRGRDNFRGFRGNYNRNSSFRGHNRGFRGNSSRGYVASRGSSTRGKSGKKFCNSFSNQRSCGEHVNTLIETQTKTESEQTENECSENQFFRD